MRLGMNLMVLGGPGGGVAGGISGDGAAVSAGVRPRVRAGTPSAGPRDPMAPTSAAWGNGGVGCAPVGLPGHVELEPAVARPGGRLTIRYRMGSGALSDCARMGGPLLLHLGWNDWHASMPVQDLAMREIPSWDEEGGRPSAAAAAARYGEDDMEDSEDEGDGDADEERRDNLMSRARRQGSSEAIPSLLGAGVSGYADVVGMARKSRKNEGLKSRSLGDLQRLGSALGAVGEEEDDGENYTMEQEVSRLTHSERGGGVASDEDEDMSFARRASPGLHASSSLPVLTRSSSWSHEVSVEVPVDVYAVNFVFKTMDNRFDNNHGKDFRVEIRDGLQNEPAHSHNGWAMDEASARNGGGAGNAGPTSRPEKGASMDDAYVMEECSTSEGRDGLDWVRESVFYHIFPDRFSRSTKRGERPGYVLDSWGAPPQHEGFQGGDLDGVVERLDYLQGLGVNALYLTPVFQSSSNHRYHVNNYYEVCPLLGGDAALQRLLDAAHGRGMRVVMDGVFNHSGRGHPAFVDLVENQERSAYRDWYKVRGFPVRPYGGGDANYECWYDMPALPKWNVKNSGVRAHLLGAAKFWLDRGIDGWRLDCPGDVESPVAPDSASSPSFWREFRETCSGVKEGVYLCGEIWTVAPEWCGGLVQDDGTRLNAGAVGDVPSSASAPITAAEEERAARSSPPTSAKRPGYFDGLMNYTLGNIMLGFFGADVVRSSSTVGGEYGIKPLGARAFAKGLDAVHAAYASAPAARYLHLNLVDSHDTARVLWMLQGDKSALKLAMSLMCSVPGAPMLYYGTEVGMTGGPDPDNRRAFPWYDQGSWDKDLLGFTSRALHVRRSHPVLNYGSYAKAPFRVISPSGVGNGEGNGAVGADDCVYVSVRTLSAEGSRGMRSTPSMAVSVFNAGYVGVDVDIDVGSARSSSLPWATREVLVDRLGGMGGTPIPKPAQAEVLSNGFLERLHVPARSALLLVTEH